MEAYIRGLIPNLAQLRDMPAAFVQMYCRIAAHKFFFFCDPHRRGLCYQLSYVVLLLFCIQQINNFSKNIVLALRPQPIRCSLPLCWAARQTLFIQLLPEFSLRTAMLTPTGKACIKKILLSNCLQELMELHQVNSSCCLLQLYAIKLALTAIDKYCTSSLKCMPV